MAGGKRMRRETKASDAGVVIGANYGVVLLLLLFFFSIGLSLCVILEGFYTLLSSFRR